MHIVHIFKYCNDFLFDDKGTGTAQHDATIEEFRRKLTSLATSGSLADLLLRRKTIATTNEGEGADGAGGNNKAERLAPTALFRASNQPIGANVGKGQASVAEWTALAEEFGLTFKHFVPPQGLDTEGTGID